MLNLGKCASFPFFLKLDQRTFLSYPLCVLPSLAWVRKMGFRCCLGWEPHPLFVRCWYCRTKIITVMRFKTFYLAPLKTLMDTQRRIFFRAGEAKPCTNICLGKLICPFAKHIPNATYKNAQQICCVCSANQDAFKIRTQPEIVGMMRPTICLPFLLHETNHCRIHETQMPFDPECAYFIFCSVAFDCETLCTGQRWLVDCVVYCFGAAVCGWGCDLFVLISVL